MNKKLFSRGLYLEGLRQLRIVGFISLAFFLLIEISSPVLKYIEYVNYPSDATFPPESVFLLDMAPVLMIVPVLVAPIMMLNLFSSFNRRNSSDFYHSLPYTRLCMFFSLLAAVFTWLIAVTVVSGSVGIILHVCMPKLYLVSFKGSFDIILSIIAMTLLVVNSVSAAMSVTGTFVANITVSGLILFLPRMIMYIVTFAISNVMPVVEGVQTASFLELRYNVLVNFFVSMMYSGENPLLNNIDCDIYTIVVALLMGAAAAVLFCRRKSETAEHSAPGRRVQATIRIAVAMVICALITCFLITDDISVGWAIVWYMFAVIVYFAYELISTKSWTDLPRAFPGLGVLALLNLLIVGVVMSGSYLVASYTPAPEELSAIRLISADSSKSNYNDYIDFSTYAERKSCKVNITQPEALKVASEALTESVKACKDGTYHYNGYLEGEGKQNYVYANLAFVSKNNTVRNRSVKITEEAYDSIIGALSHVDGYYQAYTEIPAETERTLSIIDWTMGGFSNQDISVKSLAEVLECLRGEIKEIGFEKWYDALRGMGHDRNHFQIYFSVEDTLEKIAVPIYSDSTPKSFNLLLSKLYDSSKAHKDKLLELMATEGITDDEPYLYFSCISKDEKGKILQWDFNAEFQSEKLRAEYKECIETLREAIRNTDGEISGENCLTVEMNYYSEVDGKGRYISKQLYLPAPEDFSPDPAYFHIFSDGVLVD